MRTLMQGVPKEEWIQRVGNHFLLHPASVELVQFAISVGRRRLTFSFFKASFVLGNKKGISRRESPQSFILTADSNTNL